MNSTLTLSANLAKPARTRAAPLSRFLAGKWDLIAVLGLLASSTAYGVYALTQMTGFSTTGF